jgi:AraC-like DNA-binding protein
MNSLQFILFRYPGTLLCAGEEQPREIDANTLVISSVDAHARALTPDDVRVVFCYPGELQRLYRDVADLLSPATPHTPALQPIRPLPGFSELTGLIDRLNEQDRPMLLKFIYSYCLTVDNAYFSALLRPFGSTEQDLSYLHDNCLKSWPVAEFAQAMKLSVSQLNLHCYRQFGMSAKQWLMEQRLRRARELLLSSQKRIIEIALECGFSHHAHFTGAFKKRFNCCPVALRAGME